MSMAPLVVYADECSGSRRDRDAGSLVGDVALLWVAAPGHRGAGAG